jgi:hypothetical protein
MAKIIPPKKIVYLIGAGATHAEAMYQGGHTVNLLMKDSDQHGEGVCSRVLRNVDIPKRLNFQKENEIDIEKLISLLGSSSNARYRKIAEDLRANYYKVILSLLAKTGVLAKPELAMGILEMHKVQNFQNIETLSGLIILNHDSLFPIASQKIYGGVNLGFKFNSISYRYVPYEDGKEKNPLIIKLYGSFDWRNGIPINIVRLNSRSKYRNDMLWIPPSILKESRDYPYNKLMGMAYELLAKRCDILRVIGCSLNQNDWNIISLLFNSQYNQLFSKGTCFRIELIIDHKVGVRIQKDCSYLQNIIPIGFLSDGYFGHYKGDEKEGKEEELPKTSESNNPFMYWLKIKTNFHVKRNEIDIKNCKILKKIAEG